MASNSTQEKEAASGRSQGGYPYATLESALAVGKAVSQHGGARKPVSKSLVAAEMKAQEHSPGFGQRIWSALLFGIISGRGTYTLTPVGIRYFSPTSEEDKRRALLELLNTPSVFAEIIQRYDGQVLPSAASLGNVLFQGGHVPESWKGRVSSFFISAAQTAGILDGQGCLRFAASMEENGNMPATTAAPSQRMELDPTLGSLGIFPQGSTFLPSIVPQRDVFSLTIQDPETGSTVMLQLPQKMSPGIWKLIKGYIDLLDPTAKK